MKLHDASDELGLGLGLISRRQAAEMQGYKSSKSVYRQEKAGLLTPIKLNSRTTRYFLYEVKKLIANATVKHGGSQ